MIVELVIAGVLFLAGVVSAARSLRQPVVDDSGRGRVLIAVHETARALFWFSLGAFFLAWGLVEEPWSVRWIAIAPIAMAAVRLVTAALLARE